MKGSKKTVFITVEYYDRNEFVKSIDKIKSDILLKNLTSNKEVIRESKINWKIQYDQIDDFREEIINGVLCRIYQSKMNSN